MISVIRARGGSKVATGTGTFTGEVWKEPFVREHGINVANVHFAPCARTDWHTHDGGQLIFVLAGEALVGHESGAELLEVGDIAWTPGGVPHWHGATDDRFMIHKAVSFESTDWHRPVDDSTYEAALEVARRGLSS